LPNTAVVVAEEVAAADSEAAVVASEVARAIGQAPSEEVPDSVAPVAMVPQASEAAMADTAMAA
jgi:hypothetical protein